MGSPITGSAKPGFFELSLDAQKWITDQQRAGLTAPESGWVVCHLGKPFGCVSALGEASRFLPGVVAVPVPCTGGFWITIGGNPNAGACEWEKLVADE